MTLPVHTCTGLSYQAPALLFCIIRCPVLLFFCSYVTTPRGQHVQPRTTTARSHRMCDNKHTHIWCQTRTTALPHQFVFRFCGPSDVMLILYKKLKNVSCEYDRWNGWNSTLQAAWYIRYVRIIRFLWTKRTILLIQGTQFYDKNRSRVFYSLCFILMNGDSPGCCQDQQDDFP